MESSTSNDGNTAKIRDALNKAQIKLWLAPYTSENGEKAKEPKELAAEFSADFGLEEATVLKLLEELRQHAVRKLAAKRKMQDEGMMQLRIKLTTNSPRKGNNQKSPDTILISITAQGQEVKKKVAEHYGIDESCLKLITCGRVIEDQKSIQEQNIRSNAQIMAIKLSESEAESRRREEQAAMLLKTRQAAELLSSKSEDDEEYFLQIADQTGKPLELPAEERKALTMAMTLHEKGRASMKKKDRASAVLLLLEADKEFRKCRSEILNAVDNYAILCLDIVWCYLCLKNINDLPDAEMRLRSCEECFNRSYGENLERLNSVKGDTATEQALFMRLHLLQGVLAYHQSRPEQARHYMHMAESELRRLQVDDTQLSEVMSLGFSMAEARLGLRTCSGNVQMAVDHIIKKKEERKKTKEREKEERKNKKLQKKIGKTANGEWVNMDFYQNLLSMGFPKGASSQALRQANNDLTQALQVLQEQPELLSLPDPVADLEAVRVTEEMLAQVIALGFDEESARLALGQFSGSVQRAVEELLKAGGIAPFTWQQSMPEAGPSSSPGKSLEEKKREQEMIETIIPDIPDNEEDHLDMSLEEEAEFLQEYLNLLSNL